MKNTKNPHDKKLMIRNSTAEFLMFTSNTHQDSIEVRFEDETLWLTQKLMAQLFDVSIPTINEHLKNLFTDKELEGISTIRKFLIVQIEGIREVRRETEHYNLDAIIAVGFRVNSDRARVFRTWAITVLKEFAVKGYVLDKKRLENGSYLGRDYFNDLLEEIREIRASERRFYQKITDIYGTAIDYDKDAELTKIFFQTVQNKLHYAIHGNTAAELIVGRANAEKSHMGLTTWKKAPEGKILKSDIGIAKNYLDDHEIASLERIVSMYLDYAEDQASRNIPMTMQDWRTKLDAFLQFNERDILDNPGKVSMEIAQQFAESEFGKYRIVQDRLYENDFDKEIKNILEQEN
jgi:hypothetical protein